MARKSVPLSSSVEVAEQPANDPERVPAAPETIPDAEAKPETAEESVETVPIRPQRQTPIDLVAQSRLKQARALMEKNETAARKRLQEIIDKYPDTDAAKEAAKLLGK